ncbi:MAG TPA: RNA pseudouridine synthase, partial [Clostridia bacterium]|nr:RNA pseudouridine synthase [Clostridia bacterium]
LKKDIKLRYNKPGNVYLGLIHRLDRPVGGVMVFAKTSKAASRLSDQIRRGKFTKQYMAVIHDRPDKDKGTLLHYLLKDNKTNTVFAVNEGTKRAKKAILDYEVVNTAGDFSLVKINLRTGRPHQIRVQFSSMGHPLYGDQRYNFRKDNVKDQIALWSYKIICNHPTLKEEMTFTSLPVKRKPWTWF